MTANELTWTIVALATAGVVLRPLRLPEALWAVLGALLLVASGLLSWRAALAGAARGSDVYLFLTGMMLLAELAREEGLFDWLAARATRAARGSPTGLFTLVFLVGALVTAFLSNDATAVVLTPAVAAVMRAADAKEPVPYLLVCAFIANAASFVLPISNPANLVLYGSHMPPLLHWLPLYALPSALSILATYFALLLTERRRLAAPIATEVEIPVLSACGHLTAWGIAATAAVLLTASAFDIELGLPTFLCGCATALPVFFCSRSSPLTPIRNISWGILPLVAGLFVMVQALERTGATGALAALLRELAQNSAALAAWLSGVAVAVGCNLVNNLPAGLFAERAVEAARVTERVRAALLIGVDLGPNLSVTGSLATILWLTALKRDGYHVDAWTFLKIGVCVMPPALLLALLGALGLG
jgi:arsenical pump membrane protein